MLRFVRRLVWLVAFGAAAAVVARWWSARSVPAPAAAPVWPPFDPPAATAATGTAARAAAAVTDSSADDVANPVPVQALVATSSDTIEVAVRPAWVLPVDGACPPGYPVKANDNSGIFHVPGGRSYDRTKPERCYVDAAAAAADGYRAAKA